MQHRFALAIVAASTVIAGCSASAQTNSSHVTEQAMIPGKNGTERTVQVLKSGQHLETVTCRDFNMLDESFRPQAINYAANYGPKGKAHPTETVTGVESVMPMVVASCRARPGDHFVGAVHRAMMTHR